VTRGNLHCASAKIPHREGRDEDPVWTCAEPPGKRAAADYRLLDSNDPGLLSRIRQLSPRSAVPMMTAFATPEVIAQALALGVSRAIEKPFEMHDLERLVAEVCASGSCQACSAGREKFPRSLYLSSDGRCHHSRCRR
jgi:DNA-binding NarL/FixJ family response regulator